MAFLLDANILIALAVKEHVSHEAAMRWLVQSRPEFATCPITEGALVRYFVRHQGASGLKMAKALLHALREVRGYRFWADDIGYQTLPDVRVMGHKQVTDLYLVVLAESKGAKLATLDQGLAAWMSGSVELVR